MEGSKQCETLVIVLGLAETFFQAIAMGRSAHKAQT
jgi:hypothetical protein